MIKLYKIYKTNNNIEGTPHFLEVDRKYSNYSFACMKDIVTMLLIEIKDEIEHNFKFIDYNIIVKQYNYAVEIHISKDLLFIIAESEKVSIETIYKQLGW